MAGRTTGGGGRGTSVAAQPPLPLTPSAAERLDIGTLETWLWDAACAIRGATDAPKFKDFILPLVFYKRLSDVFDDELAAHVETYGDPDVAAAIVEEDHADALKTGRRPIVRFYVPRAYRWDTLRNHPIDKTLGEFVTLAMRTVAWLNPDLQGVLDVKDYNERQSGQRTLDDDRLAGLIEVVSRHRLGLANAEPDILGRAYEYLLRKFAEGQGQSAGEFYTPKEVGNLMAALLDPAPMTTVCDPACGSGGLLIKARAHYEARHPDQKGKAPRLYGQELNPTTFAIAKMNMFLHDYTNSIFAIGDTFRNPGFGVRAPGCAASTTSWPIRCGTRTTTTRASTTTTRSTASRTARRRTARPTGAGRSTCWRRSATRGGRRSCSIRARFHAAPAARARIRSARSARASWKPT